jgi:hypothetical protein
LNPFKCNLTTVEFTLFVRFLRQICSLTPVLERVFQYFQCWTFRNIQNFAWILKSQLFEPLRWLLKDWIVTRSTKSMPIQRPKSKRTYERSLFGKADKNWV